MRTTLLYACCFANSVADASAGIGPFSLSSSSLEFGDGGQTLGGGTHRDLARPHFTASSIVTLQQKLSTSKLELAV